MKKVISVLLVSVLMLSFTACVGNSAKKALEQSELAMANGDYKIALNYLKMAQEKGEDKYETMALIELLTNYLEAKEAFEKGSFGDASLSLGKIPDSYERYSVAAEIDDLRNNIEKAVENEAAKEAEEEAEKDMPEEPVTPPVPPQNTTVIATYYVVNCNQSISLRTTPSTSSQAITQIPLGKAVGFIENAGNGFYKINYDGLVGYSLAAYLSPNKPYVSQNNTPAVRLAQVVNCENWITLRKTPSVNSEALAQIPLGTYVTYISTAENGFYCIEYMGQRGYGLQSYLALG